MSKKPILYMSTISPPSRAVLMTGAELGIDFELKSVDLLNFEHKTSEYIKVKFKQKFELVFGPKNVHLTRQISTIFSSNIL